MKQVRKRLTYANVMSSIAVFLVLGGATAFAASTLGKNTVGPNAIKKNAVTAAKIKNGAVTATKIARGAVGSSQINTAGLTVPTATNATNAANAANAANSAALGAIPAAGYQKALRFAVVEGLATKAVLIRGNATSVSRVGTGNYLVSFAGDIRGCAYIATDGDVGAGAGEPGEISVEQESATNPSTVEVRTYDSEGNAEDPGSGDGFHLAVVCP